MKLDSAAALHALAETAPSAEAFGPGSPAPWLCFPLSGAPADLAPSRAPSLASWLSHLPCPVIGLGEGPLRPACDVVLPNDARLASMTRNIEHAPIAAMILVQYLRASEALTFDHALTMESFAYSAVQRGPEFLRWRAEADGRAEQEARGGASADDNATSPLIVDITEGRMRVTLNRPGRRNEIDAGMRDALCEVFDLALADPSISSLRLDAAGACFSAGGAVSEFGEAPDPATAHWVRSLRLPAARLVSLRKKFGENLHAHVSGAAIGAGAEIAAFAGRLTASPKAWFQLPELKYGLIPGAGGCVSIPRRIGRQRAAWLALSMRRINAATALQWGLVDAIES